MAQMLLVNPRKRKKRSTKMATRKQLAALRKARAAKARKHHPRAATPRRRRKSASRKRHITLRGTMNPSRRTRRHYRRNPSARKFNLMGFVKESLMPSAMGAGGALALDLALAYLPLPAMMKTGVVNSVTRVVGAVGIGMLGGMVMGRKVGEQIGAGALTVVLYDEIKGMLKKAMPTLPLSGSDYPSLEYVNPAINAGEMGLYVGEYVPGDETQMGNMDYNEYQY